MKSFKFRSIVPAALLLVAAITAHAGGWAVITVKNLPEYFIAGKPATLSFVVRQHGVSPLDGLSATVAASEPGGMNIKGVVKPAGIPGEYEALLTFPKGGDWTIRIDSNYLGDSTLLPMKAIPADSPAPGALSQIARGEQLFVAKGCIACHVNKEVAAKNLVDVGPELTGRKFSPDTLKKFLADPPAMLGKTAERSSMPNLGLAKDEIDALEAFINRDRTIGARGNR